MRNSVVNSMNNELSELVLALELMSMEKLQTASENDSFKTALKDCQV